MKVMVETSARHVHVTQETLEKLFGAGATLTKKKELSQPGQFASMERITIVGPKGEMKNVSVLLLLFVSLVTLRVLLDVSLLVLLVRLILKRVLSLQSVTFTSHPKMQKNLALRTSRLSALKLVERAESLSSEMLL